MYVDICRLSSFLIHQRFCARKHNFSRDTALLHFLTWIIFNMSFFVLKTHFCHIHSAPKTQILSVTVTCRIRNMAKSSKIFKSKIWSFGIEIVSFLAFFVNLPSLIWTEFSNYDHIVHVRHSSDREDVLSKFSSVQLLLS